MQQLGIYPGTFDPIHKGHVAFALESIKACGLDEVIFLPEATPRGKVNVTSVSTRLRQIAAAIDIYLHLSTQVLSSPQFTVSKTLPELEERFQNATLTLLVGSDVALGLHMWDGIEKLLAVCNIAIGIRTDESDDQINQQLGRLQQLCPSTQFTIIKTDYPSLASSAFRIK